MKGLCERGEEGLGIRYCERRQKAPGGHHHQVYMEGPVISDANKGWMTGCDDLSENCADRQGVSSFPRLAELHYHMLRWKRTVG